MQDHFRSGSSLVGTRVSLQQRTPSFFDDVKRLIHAGSPWRDGSNEGLYKVVTYGGKAVSRFEQHLKRHNPRVEIWAPKGLRSVSDTREGVKCHGDVSMGEYYRQFVNAHLGKDSSGPTLPSSGAG